MTALNLNGVPFKIDLSETAQTSMFYGSYEPNEIAFLRRTLLPGQFFVDAGANIGYYSAIALSIVGKKGTVVAFEPMPVLFGRLQTLALNAGMRGFNLLVENKALGASEGEVLLMVSKGDNIGWCTIIGSLMHDSEVKETHAVQIVRLDEFLDHDGNRPPDFVKIDVEGAEDKVLRGMSKLFAKAVFPVLMIEPRDTNWDSVTSILTSLGYKPFRCLKDGRLTAIDGFSEAKCYLSVWLRPDSIDGHQLNDLLI